MRKAASSRCNCDDAWCTRASMYDASAGQCCAEVCACTHSDLTSKAQCKKCLALGRSAMANKASHIPRLVCRKFMHSRSKGAQLLNFSNPALEAHIRWTRMPISRHSLLLHSSSDDSFAQYTKLQNAESCEGTLQKTLQCSLRMTGMPSQNYNGTVRSVLQPNITTTATMP